MKRQLGLLQRKQPLTFILGGQVSRDIRPKGRPGKKKAQSMETLLEAQDGPFPGSDHHLSSPAKPQREGTQMPRELAQMNSSSFLHNHERARHRELGGTLPA